MFAVQGSLLELLQFIRCKPTLIYLFTFIVIIPDYGKSTCSQSVYIFLCNAWNALSDFCMFVNIGMNVFDPFLAHTDTHNEKNLFLHHLMLD